MSSAALPARPLETTRSLGWLRWVGLGALLFAEVMFLTLRFDTGNIYHVKGWWAELLGQSWIIPQVCVAVTAALLLFGGTQLRAEFKRIATLPREHDHAWSLLAGQLTVYLCFTAVTGVLLGGSIESLAHPGIWALLWLTLAAATGLTWFSLVLPPRLWLPLVKHAWIPLLVGLTLGIAAWGAGRVTTELWRPLSTLTLKLVYFLLSLVVPDVVYDPVRCLLGTQHFWVLVAPACSGYEGIGLIWVFLAGYLWFFRHQLRFPQAFVLFPLGTLVIYIANVIRIFSLILLGSYWSPEIALGGFHSQAGWLALNAVALGLVGITGRSRFFTVGNATTEQGRINVSAAYLMPFLAIVLVSSLTQAFTHGRFDYTYPIRVLAVAACVFAYRKAYRSLSWRCSWEAVAAGVGVFALWIALDTTFDATANARFATALDGMGTTWATLWLICRVIGAVVTVPIAEELAFRGYLSRRLVRAEFDEVPMGQFTWFSFVISSVVFGFLHGRFFAGTIAGMAYAFVVCRNKRLSDGIWAHGITNGLIAAYVLATGSWNMW